MGEHLSSGTNHRVTQPCMAGSLYGCWRYAHSCAQYIRCQCTQRRIWHPRRPLIWRWHQNQPRLLLLLVPRQPPIVVIIIIHGIDAADDFDDADDPVSGDVSDTDDDGVYIRNIDDADANDDADDIDDGDIDDDDVIDDADDVDDADNIDRSRKLVVI